jgi:DNA repair protein RadC
MRSKHQSRYSLLVRDVLILKDSQYTRAHLQCRTPADVYKICSDILDSAQEMFQLLTINTRNFVIDRHLATLGTTNTTLISPSVVFRHAIMDSADTIVLVHNHPSGDPTPSAEDVRVTQQLIEAGRIVNIKVIDHIVIGRGATVSGLNYCSMRECGLLQFT